MAKVITTELQHSGASGANVTLDSSKNVTCENNLQVDGNVTVTGTLPADKLTGTAAAINGSNITNLPAANLTGTLPAISGASLTGISSLKPFRNLIVNGACQVAQHGVGPVDAGGGRRTADRWWSNAGWGEELPSITQHALTSSDTGPWALGFRHSFMIQNGNQTGSSNAEKRYIDIQYNIEAQDIASSGWEYTSASSKVTLSFWIKSSVAQTFYGNLITNDGTSQNYPFSTGALSADTWTKITKTIPGHANLQFDYNTNKGLEMHFWCHAGSNKVDAGASVDTWAAYASTTQVPANTSTWYTTNDATLEMTGLQLEVGDTATDFEHRSYESELRRCLRYYYRHAGESENSGSDAAIANCSYYDSDSAYAIIQLPVKMRVEPSLDQGNSQTNAFRIWRNGGMENFQTFSISSAGWNWLVRVGTDSVSGTGGWSGYMETEHSSAYLAFDADI